VIPPVTRPRIVVLMSCYNEQAYLDETIPSVLEQSVDDIALIVLDNGSTDASGAMLDAFARVDGRLHVLRSRSNLWPPVVSNLLMRTALAAFPRAAWYLAHGADDLMEPGYLQAILDAAAANPDANCVFSPWAWIDHPEKGEQHFPAFDPATCHAVHQVPAWRAITRPLWELVGRENESIRIGSDWEWPVRARHVLRIVQLERPYLALRVRDGERTSQSDEVHWPSLHRHLCGIVGAPVPPWAKDRSR